MRKVDRTNTLVSPVPVREARFDRLEPRVLLSTLTEVAHLRASDAQAGDRFGYDVAIDGDFALVGQQDVGPAYLFSRGATTWTEAARLVVPSDGVPFGYPVSLQGQRAIVGSHVFEPSGGIWIRGAELGAWGPVAIDGDFAIVGDSWGHGAGGEDTGAAYLFQRSGTDWTEVATLIASDGASVDAFGCSVALDGDFAVVGAAYDDTIAGADAGSAYVFQRTGSTWTQVAKLTASDGAEHDCFGRAVAIDGDIVLVGADEHDTAAWERAGGAYAFQRSGSTWTQVAKLEPSDAHTGYYFGISVGLEGDLAVVGAIGAGGKSKPPAYDANGATYVFRRLGSAWKEVAKLIASDGTSGDFFGFSVSISGGRVIVGAPYDCTLAGQDAGSAYIFEIPASDDLFWLSKTIEVEASSALTQGGTWRDCTEQERAAVGWTVMNRLAAGTFGSTIENIAKAGYGHGKLRLMSPKTTASAPPGILEVAKGILQGGIPDPTGGATYFFSPCSMPRKGQSTAGMDVRGGLQEVPGASVMVYFPSWAGPQKGWTIAEGYHTKDHLEWVGSLPGIDNFAFMFYRRLLLFGDVDGDKNVSLKLADPDGTLVTFSLTGPGSGELIRDGRGWSLGVTGTGITSRTSITTTRSARPGDDGEVDFADVIVTGSLASLAARKANLRGNLTVSGTLGSLTLDDVMGGPCLISIGTTGTAVSSPRLTMALDEVYDLSIRSPNTPIQSLTAVQWADTDDRPDVLSAPWLGNLTISGNAVRKIAGDFAANLTLSGLGVASAGKTLSTATIKGSVAPSTWDLAGKVGSVTIKGGAGAANRPWELKNAASVGSLALGDVTNAVVTVTGDLGAVKAIRWLDGSIQAAKVASITTAGVAATKTVPGIPGDWCADVTLTNPLAKSSLATLTVAGWLDGAAVTSAGPLGTLTVGGLRSSTIAAGDLAGTPATQMALGSLTVKGIAGQTDLVQASSLSAWKLGTVTLRDVKMSNGSTAFGVSGRTLATYTRYVGKTVAKKASKLSGPLPMPVDSDTDFAVTLV